jgi:hypothetical protein
MADSGSESPIDWGGFATRRHGAPRSPSPDQAAAAVGPELQVAVPDPRPHRLALPHPSKRSRVEHELAASWMRERRARLRAQRVKEEATTALAQAADAITQHGILGANQALKVVGIKLVSTAAHGQGTRRYTFATMCRMSFSALVRQNDIARVWGCSAAWVSRVRSAVASGFLHVQAEKLLAIRQECESEPTSFFVASLAFDETTETMLLPLHPTLAPHQTRSSWHVLVAQTT